MSYFFKKVSNKIIKNITAYFLLVLELFIGTAYVTYALNNKLSSDDAFSFYKSKYSSSTVTINPYIKQAGGMAPSNQPIITLPEVASIQKVFSQEAVAYKVIDTISLYFGDVPVNYFVIYTDLQATENIEETAFVGRNIMKHLGTEPFSDLENAYSLSAESIAQYNANKAYSVKEMPQQLNGKQELRSIDGRFKGSNFIMLDDCIILPSSALRQIPPRNGLPVTLTIDTAGFDNADKKISTIVNSLSAAHSEQYGYMAQYVLPNMQQICSERTYWTNFLGDLGVLVLVELTIGFSGVILIFMKKREKELAICMALGAKRSVLVAELLTETGFICFIGAVGGIVAGCALTVGGSSAGNPFDIVCHAQAAVISALVAVVCTLLASAPMIRKILTLKPQQIMRGE